MSKKRGKKLFLQYINMGEGKEVLTVKIKLPVFFFAYFHDDVRFIPTSTGISRLRREV